MDQLKKAKITGNAAIPLLDEEKKAQKAGCSWEADKAFAAYVFCLCLYQFQPVTEEVPQGYKVLFPAISNINGKKQGHSYKAITVLEK